MIEKDHLTLKCIADMLRDKDAYECEELKEQIKKDGVYQGITKGEITTLINQAVKIIKEEKKTARNGLCELTTPSENTTNFELPVINGIQFNDGESLSCGKFFCDETGIYKVNKFFDKFYACRKPIIITKRFENIETNLTKFEIAYETNNNVWKTMIIDADYIKNSRKAVDLAKSGVAIDSTTVSNFIEYMSTIDACNPEAIKTYPSVSRMGWIDKENNSFIPYCSNVANDNESCNNEFEAIKSVGNFDIWRKQISRIRKENKIEFLITLASSFASPYAEVTTGLSFVVNLYGGTGAGKTVTHKVISSVWANPEKYFVSAQMTPTAREQKLGFLHNLPLIIDDFSQITVRKDEHDFGGVIYSLCEGKGKLRSNTDLVIRNVAEWCNITITNCERSLIANDTKGGASNRLIELEVPDRPIIECDPMRDVIEIVKNNYGTAGKKFIESVTISEVREKFGYYSDVLENMNSTRGDKKEAKQINSLALILAIDELTEKYIFEDGIRLKIEDVYALVKGNAEINENLRGYYNLVDKCRSRISELRAHPLKQDGEDACITKYLGRIIEASELDIDDDEDVKYYALIPSEYDKICNEINVNSNALCKWMFREGLLVSSSCASEQDPKKSVFYQKRVKLFAGLGVQKSIVFRTERRAE